MIENRQSEQLSAGKSTEIVGKKAYYLYKMRDAGMDVPPFFVLSTETVKEILHGLSKEISILEKAAVDGNIKLQACEGLAEKISQLHIPTHIQESVLQQCNLLFGPKFEVSVRSSATLEDGEKSSFAGQFKTYLHVNDQELWGAIKACISSAWSYEVFSYRQVHDLLTKPVQMAVVIQKMIVAERSGVAFSMNIQGNLAESLIIAGYGLGEGIVSDQSETDMFYVNRQNRTIHSSLAIKRSKTIQDKGIKLKEALLSQKIAEQPTLNSKEILAVYECCMQAEKIIGSPADVEFSFDDQGKLFCLQMRSITALNLNRLILLDNTNIIESYPGITLPLSYSFALKAYESVFRNSASAFWISALDYQELDPVFKHLIHHFKGRIYYRMDNWFRMLGLVYRSKSSYEDWEKAVGFKDPEIRWKPSKPLDKFKLFLASANMLMRQSANVRRFFKHFDASYQEFKTLDKIENSNTELWEHYQLYQEQMLLHWHYTISNDYLAFKYFGLLKTALKHIGIDESQTLANDLIANRYTNSSERAVLSLLRIKGLILSNPLYRQLFNLTNEEIEIQLEGTKYETLCNTIKTHIEEFGDRMLAELKLENPSFKQNKIGFLTLLKKQLDTSLDLDTYTARKKAIFNQAKEQLNTALKSANIFRRFYIRWLVSKSSKGIRNRENMRFCRAKGYGLVRDIFYRMAKNFVAKGFIGHEKDLFYLNMDELEDFCRGNNLDFMKQLIEQRKHQYESFEHINLPDRIIFHPDHPPNFTSSRTLDSTSTSLKGLAVSSGKVQAELIVILTPSYDLDVKGKIMVTRMTDPGWVFLMSQAAGIISEKGSLLSHTAIVGRELGLPVVVGVANATQILKTGQIVTLDADTGTIILNEKA